MSGVEPITVDYIKAEYRKIKRQLDNELNIVRQNHNGHIAINTEMFFEGADAVGLSWHTSCKDNTEPIWKLESCENQIYLCRSENIEYINGWFETLNYILWSSYCDLIKRYSDN